MQQKSFILNIDVNKLFSELKFTSVPNWHSVYLEFIIKIGALFLINFAKILY